VAFLSSRFWLVSFFGALLCLPCAAQTIAQFIPLLMSVDEIFDIGVDTRISVDDFEYRVPFRFTARSTSSPTTSDPSSYRQRKKRPLRKYSPQPKTSAAIEHEMRDSGVCRILKRRAS
jgi:hypothetical protein